MRYGRSLFILTALVLHLFFGQHDASAPLVLCLGEDGHVAVESTQSVSETGSAPSQQSGEHRCHACHTDHNCRDIALSLGHSDHHYLTLKMPVSQLAEQLALSGRLQVVQVDAFFSPELPALTLAARQPLHLPHRDTAQSLQATVLLI